MKNNYEKIKCMSRKMETVSTSINLYKMDKDHSKQKKYASEFSKMPSGLEMMMRKEKK